MDGSLRCRTPGEVFLFLKSSELLSGDIETAYVRWCSLTDISFYARTEHGSPVVLVLRKWTQIDEGAEFRCFVKDNRLRGADSAVSQTSLLFLLRHQSAPPLCLLPLRQGAQDRRRNAHRTLL